MKKWKHSLRRVGVVCLSAAIAISFMPLMGGQPAFANQEETSAVSVKTVTADEAKSIPSDATITWKDVEKAGSIDAAAAEAFGIDLMDTEVSAEETPAKAGKADVSGPMYGSAPKGLSQPVQSERYLDSWGTPHQTNATLEVDDTYLKSNGKILVTGSVTGGTFEGLYVDDEWDSVGDVSGTTQFAVTINMKDYDVGYHDIFAKVTYTVRTSYEDSDGEINYEDKDYEEEFAYQYAIPTYIYQKPVNKLSNVYAASKYIKYTAPYFYNHDYVYVQLKKKGGAWKTYKKKWTSSTVKKIKGLKPDKNYSVRTYYADKVSYGGSTYTFTGADTGKYSAARAFRMGKKKAPPISYVSAVKSGKYVSRTITIWYGSYGRTYTYYYTPVRVTLKLSRLPGVKGLFLGSVRLPGNKTTYVANGTVSGKMKGKKVKLSIYSYQSKKYGGFSPTTHRTVTVR